MIKKYEMGYTPKEFIKTLCGQFTTHTEYNLKEIEGSHWLISVDDENMTVDVQIKVAAPRNLGRFSLPVLDTVFQFSNASQTNEDDFLKAFFKYFHKGGG